MPPKAKAETFESAMARIEQITVQMENNQLPLEDLVTVYEEGLRLIKFCSDRLETAEKRLQTITRNSAGEPRELAEIENPEEIPLSTRSQISATEEDSGGAGSSEDPVRLF